MRRSSRIDYKLFNSTGIKTKRQSDETEMAESKSASLNDISNAQIMSEDITDFMDEYPIENFSTIIEIDDAISTIQNLRTSFRHVNVHLLSDFDDKQKESYMEQLNNIKCYINSANNRKRNLKSTETRSNDYVKRKTIDFML